MMLHTVPGKKHQAELNLMNLIFYFNSKLVLVDFIPSKVPKCLAITEIDLALAFCEWIEK